MNEESRFGVDSENIEFDVADATDITFYMTGTGTETATVKYLNKGSLACKFQVRPDKAIGIVQIQNKVFRNPVSVSTAGVSRAMRRDFNVLVLRTTTTNTNIKLWVD